MLPLYTQPCSNGSGQATRAGHPNPSPLPATQPNPPTCPRGIPENLEHAAEGPSTMGIGFSICTSNIYVALGQQLCKFMLPLYTQPCSNGSGQARRMGRTSTRFTVPGQTRTVALCNFHHKQCMLEEFFFQIHFADTNEEGIPDRSELRLTIQYMPTPLFASIFLLERQ